VTYLFLIIIALCVFFYVAVPLTGRTARQISDAEEIKAYRTELEAIEKDLKAKHIDEVYEASLRSRKAYLQRQLVTLAGQDITYDQSAVKGWMGALALCLGVGGLSIYHQIGSPSLTGELDVMTPVSVQQEMPEDMEALVAQLGERLKSGQGDARGWGLYARSLMSLRRFNEAIDAYDKAVDLSEGEGDWVTERQRARDYISNAGPTAADIAAAEGMSVDDRQLMIQNMVDGLSDKLEDDPSDIEGWVRLLRARGVLGQTDIAQTEILRLEKAFPDQLEIVADVLERSGWSEGIE